MKNNAFVDKWGDQTSSFGWAAVPIALLFLQGKLKISPIEMNVLINLLMHWWKTEQLPYPSQDSIAYRIGVSKRTIQRAMARLEELKVIKIIANPKGKSVVRGRNSYDLSPLVKMLDEMSIDLRLDLENNARSEERKLSMYK